MDGSGAGSDGARTHHSEHAGTGIRRERLRSLAAGIELDARSAREAWELEREALVDALHDRMRNPLACLQGYVELLLDGVAGPLAHEQQALLERVRSATTRLATAVEEIVPRAVVPEE